MVGEQSIHVGRFATNGNIFLSLPRRSEDDENTCLAIFCRSLWRGEASSLDLVTHSYTRGTRVDDAVTYIYLFEMSDTFRWYMTLHVCRSVEPCPTPRTWYSVAFNCMSELTDAEITWRGLLLLLVSSSVYEKRPTVEAVLNEMYCRH